MADNSHIMAIPLERPVPQQLLEQSPIGNELGNEGQADSHKRTYQACVSDHPIAIRVLSSVLCMPEL